MDKAIPRKKVNRKLEWSWYHRSLAVECCECKCLRGRDEYYSNSSRSNGLDYLCKRCRNIYAKNRRQAVPISIRKEQYKEYYRKNSERILKRIRTKRASNLELARRKEKIKRLRYIDKNPLFQKQYYRRLAPRLSFMLKRIIKQKSLNIEFKEAMRRWFNSKAYRKLYRQWQFSGYKSDLTPTFEATNGRLEVMTWAEKRKGVSAARWSKVKHKLLPIFRAQHIKNRKINGISSKLSSDRSSQGQGV